MKQQVKPRWKPGQSGNPKGRPKGIPNPQTRLRKMIDAEAIVRKLEEAALKGDVQAGRTLLERALPVYKLAAAPVSVPGVTTAATPTDKAQAIMDAIADGRIPPDIGAQLITAVGAMVRVVEMDELERRISALEKAKGGTP